MPHRNAPLTPEGRRRLCERVDSGRPICHVAAEAGIARQTLAKWHARGTADGWSGLHDRSSRPASCPNQTGREVEDLVEWLRRGTKLGPMMLVAEVAEYGVNMHASTVHRVLLRRGVSRLADLDVSGEQMRAPAVRYEHPVAGDMIHVDVKKVGRIPPGGGWWAHGKGSDGHRASKRGGRRPGYCSLHTAIDDHSRLAYTEELPDEKAVTAAGLWQRAVAFSPPTGSSTSAGCSPTTGPATAPGCSIRPSATGLNTSTPGLIGRSRTGRSSGTTAPWPENGPTPTPGIPTRPARPRCQHFCTATTTIDHTPRCEASRPSTAHRSLPTYMGSTVRRKLLKRPS